MIVRLASRSALLLGAVASPALAQTTTPAPPSALSTAQIPVKELAPVEAKSTHTFGNVSSLRGLADGSLFVNDNQRRQVLKLDSKLQNAQLIAADSAGSPLPYGQRPAGLLSYLGDSTIIVDQSTLALLVLNQQGKVARVMAPPRMNDMNQLTSNLGSNAFDAKGRLVYRGNAGGGGGGFGGGGGGGFGGGFGGGGGGRGQGGPQGQQGQRAPGQQGGAPGQQAGAMPARGNNPLNQPDSLPILRADFDRRAADTVAWVKVPRTEMTMSTMPDGSTRSVALINPLPQGDDWALMSDGTIAVVRVLDYRVDYYSADGTVSSSGKLPFDWKRITDAEKTGLVDSLKVAAKAATDRATAQATAGGGGGNRFRMAFEPVPAEKLPDYVPPIRPGTTLADHDGNLWLLPMTSNIATQIAQTMGPNGMPGAGRGGFPGGPGFGGGPGGGPGGGGGGDRGGGAGRGGQQAQQRDSAQARRMAGDTTARRAVGDSAGRRAAGDSAGGGRGGPGAARAQAPFQLVYDVVNRKGELVERIKLPQNRTILGFAPGGVVYLGFREGNQLTIEKSRRVSGS